MYPKGNIGIYLWEQMWWASRFRKVPYIILVDFIIKGIIEVSERKLVAKY